MKIYKNPFVSRASYFIKTGVARTGKCEASASKGYSIEFIDGKWTVKEASYYDFSLKNEMPIVAENKVSIKSVVEKAILTAVLDSVGNEKTTNDNPNFLADEIAHGKHGHWIENGSYRKCSVCNRSVCERDDFGEEQWFSFCPYCAARMNPNVE